MISADVVYRLSLVVMCCPDQVASRERLLSVLCSSSYVAFGANAKQKVFPVKVSSTAFRLGMHAVMMDKLNETCRQMVGVAAGQV